VSHKVQVAALLDARAPRAMCDACLADYLAISKTQARQASAALAQSGLFPRDAGFCSGCCTTRIVTSGARRPDESGVIAEHGYAQRIPIAR